MIQKELHSCHQRLNFAICSALGKIEVFSFLETCKPTVGKLQRKYLFLSKFVSFVSLTCSFLTCMGMIALFTWMPLVNLFTIFVYISVPGLGAAAFLKYFCLVFPKALPLKHLTSISYNMWNGASLRCLCQLELWFSNCANAARKLVLLAAWRLLFLAMVLIIYKLVK